MRVGTFIILHQSFLLRHSFNSPNSLNLHPFIICTRSLEMGDKDTILAQVKKVREDRFAGLKDLANRSDWKVDLAEIQRKAKENVEKLTAEFKDLGKLYGDGLNPTQIGDLSRKLSMGAGADNMGTDSSGDYVQQIRDRLKMMHESKDSDSAANDEL
eukprot:TRINITY_DN4500_c0_g1_i2.p1 TRINITY_DN4500_c0_g1~~TRINITY_DN4500_c0_g1_i2.p1  ORF type:complete len:157 (-),score=29.80 TRINITY_DN4500_c0_g1_i2:151-621(-)